MKRFAKRAFIWSGVTVLILAGTAAASYLWILPAVVSSSWVNNIVTKETNKFLGAELKITNPKLSTGLNPKIGFTLAELSLSKNNKELLNLKNIDTAFSFQDIFAKRLIVERLLAENVYVNASGLVELFPQPEQKEQKKSDFRIDIFSAVLGVKNCLITYDTSDFGIKFDAKNVLLDRTRADGIYPLHFDFDLEMTKGKEKITVSADDKDRIYMGGGELHIDKFPIEIDRSNVIIDAFASRKTGMEINIASKNFSARDIFNIVTSNIIIPNGKELLAPILDVKGSVDFNLHLAKNTIRGDVNVNESEFKIKDLLGMPVKITQGLVEIGNTTITLKDFKGFYNNKKENSLVISGSVKDYWNCDLDSVTGSDYEVVSAFGRSSGGNSTTLSKVLTQMSNGAKAIAFAGATNVSNTTGVPAVIWKNAYATNGTNKFSFVNVATGNGSPASANPEQYKYLQDFMDNLSKKNVVVLMDRYLWGSGSYNIKERDALHDIFETAAHQYNKNVIVISSAGESNYTEIKDGVRYINLAGIGNTSNLQYLKLKGNDKDLYYEFVNVK